MLINNNLRDFHILSRDPDASGERPADWPAPQLAGLLDPAQAEMPLPTRAIEVYAPLRDYMAQQGMAPASIIGATVWTTGDPTVKIRKGAEYAASLPIAPATEMTLLEEFPEYCVVQGSRTVQMLEWQLSSVLKVFYLLVVLPKHLMLMQF